MSENATFVRCPAQASDRRILPLRITLILLLLFGLSLSSANALTLGVAGVPMGLGTTRDYDKIFAQLANNGIALFYPVFQYEEAPKPLSLGFEADFVPPCRSSAPAFEAMRRHGIKMIAPGNLLYTPGAAMPSLAHDPLAQLIGCAGPDAIFGVLSYDEPVHNGVSTKATRELYNRVKKVAPDMPVLMVHAPLIIEPGQQDTDSARKAYLSAVADQSRFADIIGFSTYPIPPMIAKMGAPNQGDAVVDHITASRDYVAWLRSVVPGKRIMSVIQNFSYADQYSSEMLSAVATPELIALVNPPSAKELDEMARTSAAAGAEIVIWYGAGFTKPADAQSWRDTLSVSARLAGQN